MIWMENEIESHDSEDRVIVCTGLTSKEVSKQMKEAQISLEKPAKYCYVCKREEGAKGADVICEESDISLSSPEVKLFAVERDFHGGRVVFFLCFECALLLNPEWYEKVESTE